MKRIELTNEDPERLDKVLADKIKASRAKIQKAIKSSAVLVNGEPVATKFPVQKTDHVEYDPEFFEIKKTDHEPPKLDILFENENVVVINKPAGLLMHETETSDEPTVVDGLIAHDSTINGVGDNPRRAGLVHRLDKYASGVLIAAKNQTAFEHLKKQFKNRLVTKKYTILVHGTLEEKVGTIDLPISRSKNSGRMAAKPESQGGKSAVTHYNVIEQFPHHALVDVQIETGRTHQIRAHFFSQEHPVVGDTLYKQKSQKLRDIGRLFLHASELTITIPSGEEKTFTAPLPEELKQVLEDIPKL